MDPTVELLEQYKTPVNRSNYLDLRFMDSSISPEDDLGAEIEMSIPEALRHPSYQSED